MKPYYESGGKCACGCGAVVRRKYVSGHNRRGEVTSTERREKIGAAQRKAWDTKRQRVPVGSSRVDGDGYRRIKTVRGKGRWRPEHILVMEEILGRRLAAAEVVHHINGDRQDNRPENLFLCRDRAHHNEVHRSQDRALRQLLAAGRVLFKDGVYAPIL